MSRRFGPPQQFERLVLLEELAAVELRDAFEQQRRRRFVARHALILSRLIGPVFYLHGFASSAKSTKAAYFAARLHAQGVALQCPDFNEPDFATLTMTRMLEQLDGELAEKDAAPSTLIGSSLGGALGVLAAARWPDRVGRLVLLAPAVMIAKPGHYLLPPEKMDEWRRRGTLPFFHYAYGEERPLEYGFHLDTPAAGSLRGVLRAAHADLSGSARSDGGSRDGGSVRAIEVECHVVAARG